MTNPLRKPSRAALLTLIAIAVLLALAALVYYQVTRSRSTLVPDRGDGRSFHLPFSAGFDDAQWYVSDFFFRSNFLRAAWVARNVHYDQSALALELNRHRVAYQPYSGAEVQKRGFYGFGRYEVVMQAAPGSGAVSSFFTHTDATFGDPHDEIDIEFLGSNTRQLHANFFTNGNTYGSIYIDLPFDAAEEVHLYAFDWQPDSIKWYVDGTRVHTVTSAELPIPQAPGRIIMNIWSGSPDQYAWHGEPEFEDGTRAVYYCVSFRALGDTSGQCSDTYTVE